MSAANPKQAVEGSYVPRLLDSYDSAEARHLHDHDHDSHRINFHLDNRDAATRNTRTANSAAVTVMTTLTNPATPNPLHAPFFTAAKNSLPQSSAAGVSEHASPSEAHSHAHDDTVHSSNELQRLLSIDELRNQFAHNQNDAIKSLVHALEAQAAATKNKWGNPAGLGLGGFAATTFILSAYNTTLLDEHSSRMLLPMALWFGGAAQLLAGVFEFAIGNTFGGTAFVGYGAFWLTYSTFVEFAVPEMLSDGATTWQLHQSIAFYLMMWLVFSIYMMIASFRQSKLLAAVFITLVITLLLLVAGNYSEDSNTVKAGGYFGLLCATLAFYGSAAVVINNSFGYSALPLGVYVHPTPPPKSLH